MVLGFESLIGSKVELAQDNTMDKKELILAGIKGIASEVPILGGLVTAYSEYDNFVKYKNIEKFLEELNSESKKVQNKIDSEFIKKAEAVSLTRKTIDSAQKEYKHEKIKMYATFLVNTYTKKFSSKQEKESILNTIDLLSPLQLDCLLFLINNIPKDNLELGVNYNPDSPEKLTFQYHYESTLVAYLVQKSPDLSTKEAEALLSSMVAIGVTETQATRGWTKVGGKQGIIGYRPTKLGLVLVDYLTTQI